MIVKVAAALALVPAAVLLTAMIGLAVIFDDDTSREPDGHPPVCVTAATATDLDAEQIDVAMTIISTGEEIGVPSRGLVVALAAGAVESRLRSLPYGDRDSLGVFQQRPSAGWGTPDELTRVPYAAAAFFGGPGGPNSHGATSQPPGLLDIPSWEQMPIGDAAQAVQRSAYPHRYAEWEDEARTWLKDLTGGAMNCDASLPIAEGEYRITDRYGYREHPITGEWKLHDGLDFAADAGTPVRAISAGEVTFVGFRPWAGPHLVEIDHRDGHTSVYGHMESANVAEGELVIPGQQVGTVGSEGLSTGPHLHLSVRKDEYLVDPEQWFAGHHLSP